MKRLLMIFVIFGMLAQPAMADDESLHFAAHFGASFALNTVFYAFYKNFFRLDKDHSFVAHFMAAGTTLFIGYAYKFNEGMNGNGNLPSNTNRALLQNTAGVLSSMITIKVLDF